MNHRRLIILPILVVMLCSSAAPALGQNRAMDSITAEELRTHLTFIASDEMMGRNTPSPQLKLAARYLATMVESYGWEPILPDGSFLQTIPLVTVSPSTSGTKMTVGERTFRFPDDFGGRLSEGTISGELVFVGLGLEQPDHGWDDYAGIDLTDKVVVILAAPSEVPEEFPVARNRLRSNWFLPLQKGARAVISVLNDQRENQMVESGSGFSSSSSTQWPGSESRGGGRRSAGTMFEVRHHVAASLLGVSESDISAMFASLRRGERVPGRALPGTRAEVSVVMDRLSDHTQNVVAYLEGSDPVLKNEYIVIGGHYDHVGIRHGAYPDSINNGADDDGSGTVALLEIAQALKITRPKRSIILGWWTGEEKGLRGASYFVEHSPVPLEQIDAMLQMDMISRNDPASICLIGSHFYSSELDAVHRRVADRLGIIEIDDKYNDPTLQRNYHSQSDHFAFHRYGIPATFFFSDIHDELHTPADEVALCDFDKMTRVVKFVYASAIELGNMPAMVKLDRDPEVTQRGRRGGG